MPVWRVESGRMARSVAEEPENEKRCVHERCLYPLREVKAEVVQVRTARRYRRKGMLGV